jgi:hypothetical protein
MGVEASPDAVLVQDFANTRDLRTFIPRGHAHRDGTGDELASPTVLRRWLVDQGLMPKRSRVSKADHARVLELRAVLRSALDRSREDDSLPPAYAAPLHVELDAAAGPRLTYTAGGVEQAIGQICAAALRTSLTGEWWRLRACAADDCHWVFFDQSKPGRGRYCAPDTCGNRVKTRAYRQRRAEATGG